MGTDQGPWQILTRYICRAVSHRLMYTLIWYDVCETNIFRLFINIARHHMDLKYRPMTLTLLVVRIRTHLILSILILNISKFCMYVYKASLNSEWNEKYFISKGSASLQGDYHVQDIRRKVNTLKSDSKDLRAQKMTFDDKIATLKKTNFGTIIYLMWHTNKINTCINMKIFLQCDFLQINVRCKMPAT